VFAFLSNLKLETIGRYDLVDRGGGHEYPDIARPAEFLLNSDGVVLWRNLSESYKVHAHSDQAFIGPFRPSAV
jgi:hypothetical protein